MGTETDFDDGGLDDEDLAAELDDTGPDDVAGEPADGQPLPDDDPGDDAGLYTGRCVGGPYDGLLLTGRFPGGVLLVDRPGRWALIYDYHPGAREFTAREQAPLDDDRRWRAAESGDYDVRAFDPDFAGDDLAQGVPA